MSSIPGFSPEQSRLFERLLAQEGISPAPGSIIRRRRNAGVAPLSFAQERLWFLQQMEPESGFYNIPTALRLRGELRVEWLVRTLERIVQRHESLRTSFAMEQGEPVQRVAECVEVKWQVVDLHGIGANRRADDLARRLAQREANRAFDLEQPPLLRVSLYRIAEREHVLLFNLHHIVSDGWSSGVLVREVVELYRAAAEGVERELPELPKLEVQYGDYAVWQREWLQGEVLEGQLGYWRKQLAGLSGVLELPWDHVRPAVQSHRGGSYRWKLGEELSGEVARMSRRAGLTLYMTLLGSWQVLLHRYSGQSDIAVGSPIANRTRPELERLIGFFSNTVVMRLELTGKERVEEVLRRVREVTLEGYGHQDVPFEKVVEALQPERDVSRTPLFQVLLVLQNAPVGRLEMAGLEVEEVKMEGETAKFDLSLIVGEGRSGEGLEAVLEYSADLYEAATVERMAGHWQRLLSGMVRDRRQGIWEVEMMSAEERAQVVEEWSGQAAETGRGWRNVVEEFRERAEQCGERVAVVSGGEHVSYGELERRSNRLGQYLRKEGVGPESRVGLCVERGVEMVVGVLGILKAGGAYVPLDPGYPKERLKYMVEDAGVEVLVTASAVRGGGAELAEELEVAGRVKVVRVDRERARIERESEQAPVVGVHAENLLYVIYTSGSTGRPKGVALSHGALANLIQWDGTTLAAGARMLQFSSISFDASFHELFCTWNSGGTVVLITREQQQDFEELARLLEREQVERIMLPAAAVEVLVREMQKAGNHHLRELISTAEQLQLGPETWAWLQEKACRVWNHYGPSETHVITAFAVSEDERGRWQYPPIGKAIGNCQVYVLDRELRPVPAGVYGEAYLGGVGVARGYLNRAELTAERFVPDGYGRQAGGRLYRSGDLARYHSDGEIEYAGRKDEQVKIRGYRIELGEIETLLRQQAAVREAAVVVREDQPGDKRLVAYVLLQGESEAESVTKEKAKALRQSLREQIPEYMVPSAVVVMQQWPLTVNGKLDRRALPSPVMDWAAGAEKAARPRTPVEEVIAGIWAEVLGLGEAVEISAEANFFELGGHSLLGTQVMSRVRSAFGVELALRALFEAPTVSRLAALVERELRSVRGLAALPLKRRARVEDEKIPLSFAQERLWFLQQMEPESGFYNVPTVLRLRGELRLEWLAGTLERIVQRHESLRTSFAMEQGEPVQSVAECVEVKWQVVDLRGIGENGGADDLARRLAQREANRAFDLEHGPLLRVSLYRIAEREHVLLFNLHHIVSDGWSSGVLVREVVELYRAAAEGVERELPELPKLEVQYGDYAVWQREWLQGEVLEEQLGYWRKQLAGLSGVLELPWDHVRPAVQSHRGGSYRWKLGEELSAEVARMSRRAGLTLYMTLLASWQVLLHRYSGQSDIAVGSPIANRTRPELEGLIGFFSNTVVMRLELTGKERVEEVLRRVREVTLEGYGHQDVPFEKVVEALQPERDVSRTPLFQVLLVLQNAPVGRLEMAGLEVEEVQMEGETAKFDLSLIVGEGGSGEGLEAVLEYSTDLYEAATVERMAGHWQRLLAGMVREGRQGIWEVEMMSAEERAQVVEEWSGQAAETGRGWRNVVEEFRERAAQCGERVAVVSGGEHVSYGELERRSNRLGQYLRKEGVGPESRVGLCVERGVEMVVGVLGILKAGGAYVPLDPGYPKERLKYMTEDAGVEVLVTASAVRGGGAELAEELEVAGRVKVVRVDRERARIERESEQAPVVGVHAENLLYVIYTSGSTGRPKGVALSHGALANLIQWDGTTLAAGARMLQFSSISFDASFHELFCTWNSGGTVVLITREQQQDFEELARLLEREQVERIMLPAAAVEVLVREMQKAGNHHLRELISTAEQLQLGPETWAWLKEKACRVWNHYGPSETHVITAFAVSEDERERWQYPPIGKAIGNCQVYVLDRELRPVPAGVYGEAYLGGVGVARGYLNRAELTAERFVPDGYGRQAGGRLYRSGDLARYHSDGEIEYVGRKDEQVKIRGYRIELGEIETLLRQQAGVREAAVVVREDQPGDKRLVAYVLLQGEVGESKEQARILRQSLREQIPEYMVPSAAVVMQQWPLTVNGKLDRRALPSPVMDWAAGAEKAARPRTPVEEVIAGIWAEVLGLGEAAEISAEANFFELGGHSLLGTQVMSRVRSAFGIELALRALFEAPTVSRLGALVEQGLRSVRGLAALPLKRRARVEDEKIPLSFAQERLWILQQMEPGSAAFNLASSIRIRGELSFPAVLQTLTDLMTRHEILRTRFVVRNGEVLQQTSDAAATMDIIDLSLLPEPQRIEAAYDAARRQSARIFDLQHGPLLRASLILLAPHDTVLVIATHHIAADGWSIGIMVREFFWFYRNQESGDGISLPELPVQYADYAVWQRNLFSQGAYAEGLDYWRGQLWDAPLLELPADAIETSEGAADFLRLTIPAEQAHAARRLAHETGSTLFMVLLAAFKILLAKYTSQTDIVVGTDVTCRNREELEGQVGMFVNQIALRTDVSGDPAFVEVVDRVRKMALSAYLYQEIPFQHVVEALGLRSSPRSPLFSVKLTLQNLPAVSASLPEGLLLEPFAVEEADAKLDMTLFLQEEDGKITGTLHYNRSLFSRAGMERFAGRFQQLLYNACLDPRQLISRIPMTTAEEEAELQALLLG